MRASSSATASNISGHSINDDSPELIKKAEAMLIKQKPNIKSFHEDNGPGPLAVRARSTS
jgi:spermidine/putrescine transport system substrate-binding protein